MLLRAILTSLLLCAMCAPLLAASKPAPVQKPLVRTLHYPSPELLRARRLILFGAIEDGIDLLLPMGKRGDMGAMYMLGVAYGTSITGNERSAEDLAQSLRWHLKAADAGFVPAMFEAANAYFYGRGTPVNFTKGAPLMRRAADAGNASAQFLAADMLLGGYAGKIDPAAAARYALAAFKQTRTAKGYDVNRLFLHHNASFCKSLQQLLANGRFYKGAIDGKCGRGTLAALALAVGSRS